MRSVYLTCFIIGFAYAFISSALSSLFGGDHGDVGHADMGHGDLSIPVLSPTIMAAFATGFGGTGILITTLTQWSPIVGGVLAVGGGVVVGGAIDV